MATDRDTDVYFKKTIPFNFSKERLQFRDEARAISRLATFAHAISSTPPTM